MSQSTPKKKGVELTFDEASKWLALVLSPRHSSSSRKTVAVFQRYWNYEINLSTLKRLCGFDEIPTYLDRFVNLRRNEK